MIIHSYNVVADVLIFDPRKRLLVRMHGLGPQLLAGAILHEQQNHPLKIQSNQLLVYRHFPVPFFGGNTGQ